MMEQDSALARVALVTNRRAAAKRIEQRPRRPGESTATEASTLAQLMALKRMSVNEMKAKWEALFAAPAPNNSRGYLECIFQRSRPGIPKLCRPHIPT